MYLFSRACNVLLSACIKLNALPLPQIECPPSLLQILICLNAQCIFGGLLISYYFDFNIIILVPLK